MRRKLSSPPVRMGVVALLGILVLTGCSLDSGRSGASSVGAAPAEASVPSPSPSPLPSGPPTVSVALAGGELAAARPDSSLRVSVASGELKSVIVLAQGQSPTKIAGTLRAAGEGVSTWSPNSPLPLATQFEVSAGAWGPGGLGQGKLNFSTLTPAAIAHAKVLPIEGMKVGVGQNIVVYFTRAVADRSSVEKTMLVTAEPAQVGAWRWVSDTEAHWRPKVYWKAGSKVRLQVGIGGREIAPGVWGAESRDVRFSVGRSRISTIDLNTKTMTVVDEGKPVRSIPISGGSAKYPTYTGISTVLTKERRRTMDSATVGITGSEAYVTKVEWATRFTNSGEFVHAAPWSVRSQGRRNVSHGCINASTANARWFQETSLIGDVIDVRNGGKPLRENNGNTDWNVAWETWIKG